MARPAAPTIHRVIAAQVRVTLDLREEDAVGHHAQPCLRRAFVGEAHLIAHFVAQMHAELTRDAFCHSARGEPARLFTVAKYASSKGYRVIEVHRLP